MRLRVLYLIVAVAGALLGAFREPRAQDVVEPAQVLAGLVTYPTPSPTSLYSTSTWTVAHQVAAALLGLGLDEFQVSVLFSAVLGALSLCALASLCAAAGLRGAAVVTVVLGIYWSGATEPAALMGVQTTYGVLGASLTLLAIGLTAAGVGPGGGIAAGLLLCVHPAWAVLSVPMWVGWAAMSTASPLRRPAWWKGWGIGLALSLASAAWHATTVGFGSLPGLTPYAGRDLALVLAWDAHRAPFDLWSWECARACVLVGLALVMWRSRVLPPLRDASLAVAAVCATGLFLVPVTWWPAVFPGIMTSLMPTRVLVLAPLAMAALAVGGLVSSRSAWWGHVALLMFLVWPWTGRTAGIDLAVLTAALAVVVMTRAWGAAAPDPERNGAGVQWWLAALVPVLVVATVVDGRAARAELQAVDPVLVDARGRSGAMLTAEPLHFVQWQTRRPVLFDGSSIDGLLYAPAGLPLAGEILARVYGIDAATLTREATLERFTEGHVEEVWSARSAQEWQALGAEFRFVEIVTPSDWTMNLERLSVSYMFATWRVPR